MLRLIAAERISDEIAHELGITVNTVESHRKQLLQKLGASNSAGLVRIAMETGLLGPHPGFPRYSPQRNTVLCAEPDTANFVFCGYNNCSALLFRLSFKHPRKCPTV